MRPEILAVICTRLALFLNVCNLPLCEIGLKTRALVGHCNALFLVHVASYKVVYVLMELVGMLTSG